MISSRFIRTYVTRSIKRPSGLESVNESVKRFELEDGSDFVIRPPPSSSIPYVDANSVKSPLAKTESENNNDYKIDISNAPTISPLNQSFNRNLSDDQVQKIKQMRNDGLSVSKISKEFNCPPSFISIVAPLSKSQKVVKEVEQLTGDQIGLKKLITRHSRQKRKQYW